MSESLAGRAAILKLLPLSLREWCGEPRRPLPWQGPAAAACPEPLSRPDDLWQLLFHGLYPGLSASPAPDWLRWQQSYIEVKASATPRPEMARGITEFVRTLAASKAEGLRPSLRPGSVVYAGDRAVPLGRGVTGLPLGSL